MERSISREGRKILSISGINSEIHLHTLIQVTWFEVQNGTKQQEAKQ